MPFKSFLTIDTDKRVNLLHTYRAFQKRWHYKLNC